MHSSFKNLWVLSSEASTRELNNQASASALNQGTAMNNHIPLITATRVNQVQTVSSDNDNDDKS